MRQESLKCNTNFCIAFVAKHAKVATQNITRFSDDKALVNSLVHLLSNVGVADFLMLLTNLVEIIK